MQADVFLGRLPRTMRVLLLLRVRAQLGNQWAKLARQMQGRTDNNIKNHW
jgi:hypothetical protein